MFRCSSTTHAGSHGQTNSTYRNRYNTGIPPNLLLRGLYCYLDFGSRDLSNAASNRPVVVCMYDLVDVKVSISLLGIALFVALLVIKGPTRRRRLRAKRPMKGDNR